MKDDGKPENLRNHPDSNTTTKPDDSKEEPKPTCVEPEICRHHREVPWAWERRENPILQIARELEMDTMYENDYENVGEWESPDEVQHIPIILEPLPRTSNNLKSSDEEHLEQQQQQQHPPEAIPTSTTTSIKMKLKTLLKSPTSSSASSVVQESNLKEMVEQMSIVAALTSHVVYLMLLRTLEAKGEISSLLSQAGIQKTMFAIYNCLTDDSDNSNEDDISKVNETKNIYESTVKEILINEDSKHPIVSLERIAYLSTFFADIAKEMVTNISNILVSEYPKKIREFAMSILRKEIISKKHSKNQKFFQGFVNRYISSSGFYDWTFPEFLQNLKEDDPQFPKIQLLNRELVDCFSNQLEEKVNGPVMRQKANGKISDWNEYAFTCLWNWNTSPPFENWQMHQLFPFNNPRARHIQLSMSCMSKMFGESSGNEDKWRKATRRKKNEKPDNKVTGSSTKIKLAQQLEQALHRHEYFMTMFPNAMKSIGRKLLEYQ